ncbi:MAG: SUMF1/EgtB/PvdO family nonheme iron enzyme [Polyangiaceae bacterium]|nr:SUMF1/EgtB/PvdO family nonheme iron enzyme [Polyangiaceae bacterium]
MQGRVIAVIGALLAPMLFHASGAAQTTANAPATCPEMMALVDGSFCVDRFEAHLEEISERGAVVRVWPANKSPEGARVRARSSRGVVPQAYIAQADAARACAAADKRLCSDGEWKAACKGRPATQFPYGNRRRAGACNDRGAEPLASILRSSAEGTSWGFDPMNDPRLHLVAGAVARTGRFGQCESEAGVFDMVGNVHEWTSNPSGTMRGGYYLDTSLLGEGCDYAASGHDTYYRDYSTGFRCCADPR